MTRRDDLINLQIEVGDKWQAHKELGGYSADAGKIEFLLSRMHLILYHMIQKEPVPKPPKKAKKHARNRKTKAKAK